MKYIRTQKYSNTLSRVLGLLMVYVLPILTYAQSTPTTPTTPAELFFARLGQWVGLAAPILSGVALLVFIWGIVKFLASPGGAGEGDKKGGRVEGKRMMGWSIVALFVLFSIFGIIRFIEISVYPSGNVRQSLPPPCIEGVPGSVCP